LFNEETDTLTAESVDVLLSRDLLAGALRDASTPAFSAQAAASSRALGPAGVWVLREWLPGSMPGHWLRRVFPEGWAWLTTQTWTLPALETVLGAQGFTVTWQKRFWLQPVTLQQIARMIARRAGWLRVLPAETLALGQARVQAWQATHPSEHLVYAETGWVLGFAHKQVAQ
jgi:hypothetical protein